VKDDILTRELVRKLIDAPMPRSVSPTDESRWLRAAEMCLKGFDESSLFQVLAQPSDESYSAAILEKETLHEELRNKCVAHNLSAPQIDMLDVRQISERVLHHGLCHMREMSTVGQAPDAGYGGDRENTLE
jgi:hypothetical protein